MKASTQQPNPNQSYSILLDVFAKARELLALPSNDFDWSSWGSAADALVEIDGIILNLKAGIMPDPLQLQVIFAPTGPMQEVSLSSGWGKEFLALAKKFDEALRKCA
jgi:hypothetical protein